MRNRRLLRILLLSSLAAVLCAGALIGSAESAPGRNGPRTVIVGFKAGVTPVAQADVLADAGAKPMRRYPQIRSALVSVGARTTAGAIRDLESDPSVGYADPNGTGHAGAVPNAPCLPQLWGLNNTAQTVNWTTGTPDA